MELSTIESLYIKAIQQIKESRFKATTAAIKNAAVEE